jgi:hypothetical protein
VNAQPTVEDLWARLREIENERRFNGESYPDGMCPFPFRLTGQGFFPEGDGLWRDDSQLEMPSSKTLSTAGIVFVGNDFGTLRTYLRLKKRGFENPPTWRHVKDRVRRANLPTHLTFFTNAIMGLRLEGNAIDKKSWTGIAGFAEFCREFFLYQIELLKPRLLVLLGSDAQLSFSGLAAPQSEDGPISIGNHKVVVLRCTHPYGDFHFSDQRKAEDAATLEKAWSLSQ